MKKKNFVSMILGMIGMILFALGMCMAMLPQWNAFRQGIILGCVGLLVLLIMLLVRRKMEGKPMIEINIKTMGTAFLAIIGALVLGVGMCMTMVWDGMMIQGIVVGIIGIVVLMSLIPLCKGLE